MLFYRLNSQKQQDVNITKYLIDWDAAPSKQQKVLQDFLYPYWKHKVICAEFRIPASLYRIDILNISDRIAIEYSPDSTHDFNPFFHTRATFSQRVKSDIIKIEELERNGFKVIELNEKDLNFLSRKYFLDNFGVIL